MKHKSLAAAPLFLIACNPHSALAEEAMAPNVRRVVDFADSKATLLRSCSEHDAKHPLMPATWTVESMAKARADALALSDLWFDVTPMVDGLQQLKPGDLQGRPGAYELASAAGHMLRCMPWHAYGFYKEALMRWDQLPYDLDQKHAFLAEMLGLIRRDFRLRAHNLVEVNYGLAVLQTMAERSILPAKDHQVLKRLVQEGEALRRELNEDSGKDDNNPVSFLNRYKRELTWTRKAAAQALASGPQYPAGD